MTTITLNDTQYDKIISDYFASEKERKQMTLEEVNKLADKLNEKIDIPFFFSEEKEGIIFAKIITKVDTFLYEYLPNEIYATIRTLDDGIVDDEEARKVVVRLSKLANKKIDLPFLPEVVEYLAISFIVNVIVNAMRKGIDLDKSIKKSDGYQIENQSDDEQAENILDFSEFDDV